MVILLVEDKPSEIKKAKKVLKKAGFKTVVATTLYDALRLLNLLRETIKGIITDLHFPQGCGPGGFGNSIPKEISDPSKPCGFAVIAEALVRGIPIVVCSDINSHFASYALKVIHNLELFHPFKNIPVIMNSKNWDEAVNQLQKLLAEKTKQIIDFKNYLKKKQKKDYKKTKVLVVTNNEETANLFSKFLESFADFEVIISTHDNALITFLFEEPTYVLIFEYSEIGIGNEEFNLGRQTYLDLNLSKEKQIIIRIGFENYPYPDYLKLPFNIEELNKKLLIQ